MRHDAGMQRLAGLLVLAALVVATATLFGNEFAPEASHHAAPAEADHAEAEEAEGEEEEHEEDTSAGQVASAILISIGGVALAPLAAPLANRRRREKDIAGPSRASPRRSPSIWRCCRSARR